MIKNVKVQNALRWIAVLPGAIILSWSAYMLSHFIMRIGMGIAPDPNIIEKIVFGS